MEAVELTAAQIEQVVRVALAEDIGSGDLTTDAVVPVEARCRALLLLEEPGVVCGIHVAAAVFRVLNSAVRVEPLVPEGALLRVAPVALAKIEGPARRS